MKNTKKSLRILFSSILIVFLVISVAGFLSVRHFFQLINRVVEEEQITVAPENEDFDTDEKSDTASELDVSNLMWKQYDEQREENLLNFLLVGQDRREGESRQRSDSMIVCSINKKTGQVSLISFLRDLYVQIPGYSDNKMNAAYAFGGFSLLKNVLNTNFGVSVDGCFEVDFAGFESAVNAIGGVDINLTQAEADWMGGGLYAGVNHLNGAQALEYARIRYLDNDFGRTNRQRNVIMAAFQQVKNRSITELTNLTETILPYITTDLSTTEISAMAAELFPLITKVDIHTYTVPADDAYYYGWVKEMSVLVPDLEKIHDDLFNEYLPK